MRIECDFCREETKYECSECAAALCAAHALAAGTDSFLYCPQCDYDLREDKEKEVF